MRAKVRAQNVDGNDIWYLLRDQRTWVAARYVMNTGDVKWAKDAVVPGAAGQEAAG
ncbi:hypothetical protein ACFVVX_20395 [Kitasatospora sp. NPDC058170]|uniref:hypothetical protein n=1 Tax=Kitasatospora sp. NPDC058170 TaxID=3346364 RepID=UPI0036D865DA